MRLQKMVVIYLLLLIVCAIASVNAQPSEAPALKITSMKAFLYYNQSGTLSENVIDNPSFILWNIAIGEGSADSPSKSTMVIVEVTGVVGSYYPSKKIEFVAQCEGKTILKRICEVGELNKEGKYFFPFLLYDTGWMPIKVSAKIVGQKQLSEMKKEIGFASGE